MENSPSFNVSVFSVVACLFDHYNVELPLNHLVASLPWPLMFSILHSQVLHSYII